jgi:DNA-binding transcriptional regulator YiaG
VEAVSESELAFDLIDRLHKSLRVSGHDAASLAPVLGVSAATIRNYLSGRTRPPRYALIAWAVTVGHGVTVEWLETGVR